MTAKNAKNAILNESMDRDVELETSANSQTEEPSYEGDTSRLNLNLYAGKLSMRLREVIGVLLAKNLGIDFYSKYELLNLCLGYLSPSREDDRLLAAAIINITMLASSGSDGEELVASFDLIEDRYFEMLTGIIASENISGQNLEKWLSFNMDFFPKKSAPEFVN